MKKALHYSGFFIFLFFLCNNASAYVTTSGNVSGQYWHNTDTYYVNGSLTVDAGTTFEIQAGTRVKFAPGAYIAVYGTMIANGTTVSNIIFTSSDDNTVGEVIAGSDGDPNPGDWNYIQFYGSSGAEPQIEHCILRYGGNNATAIFALVYVNSGYFRDSEVSYSESAGIIVQNSTFVFSNLSLQSNGQHGIRASYCDLEITNSSFSNNDGYAAYCISMSNQYYAGNSGSGNTINAFAIGGNIDQDYTLSESVCGFPFVLEGNVLLTENHTMTIPAGEVIKANGGGLQIYGTLNAIGTISQNIV
ncbi:MAG: hypothetical protein KDC05_06030, partial [Bacteroidales bacterium]|nr:hypothetical protein [Bacteroidales bacterium]